MEFDLFVYLLNLDTAYCHHGIILFDGGIGNRAGSALKIRPGTCF